MQATIQFLKDALRHEVKASVFYSKAAEVTRDDKTRMLYIELGGMEDGHANSLLEKIHQTPYGQAFDARAFMQGLENDLEASVSLAELQLIETGTLSQVLELAIQLEHRACANYEALAAKATDPDLKAHCLAAVEEERSHVRDLTHQLSSLDMDEGDRPGL
ncbi:MAG: ferritin family protein [Magnetococcales bacterium]|nr:ferritin family protein [Magnetococcales bacterium]